MLQIKVSHIDTKATTEILKTVSVKPTKECTKVIAESLQAASATASRLNKFSGAKVELTMSGKTATLPLSSNFKALNFAVLLQVANLCFDKYITAINPDIKSNNEILLAIAAKFGFKAVKEVSYIEFTRTIKNRLKVLNAAITMQQTAVDKVTMTKKDVEFIKTASIERKAYLTSVKPVAQLAAASEAKND